MSYDGGLRGRARLKRYVPPKPSFATTERLDACLEIADKIERGVNTPVDDLTLIAHLKVLREDMPEVELP